MSVAVENLEIDYVTPDTLGDPAHIFYGVIQPLNKTPNKDAYLRPPYTEEIKWFFALSVLRIDQQLEQRAQSGVDKLVRLEIPAAQFNIAQEYIENQVIQTITENDNHIFAGLEYGILRRFTHIKGILQTKYPSAADRLFGAIVSSTNETKREQAVMLTPTDPRWKQKQYTGDIWDDLGDSLASVTALAEERVRGIDRDAYIYEGKSLASRMAEPVILRRDFREYIPLYDETVGFLEANNIGLALPLYKNEPFVDVMWRHIDNNPHSVWAKRQARYLNRKFLIVIHQNKWLMGGDQSDSGLDGEKIYNTLPQDIKDHPRAQELLYTLQHSRLRIGSFVTDIIQLIGGEDEFYAMVGSSLEESFRAFLS